MTVKTVTAATATQAARAITNWLTRTPEVRAYHPDVKVIKGLDAARREPGNIMLLVGEDVTRWDARLVHAVAVIVYEGGPENWTSVGCHENGWMGVSEAAYRGDLDLGAFWPEAQTSYAVAIYND